MKEGGTMPLDEGWRKSTRSGSNGDCVEARRTAEGIEVRDSKDKAGAILRFTPAEWSAFLEGAKAGEFE